MALFIVTSFVSCNSDDDSSNDTSADLVGTWNITAFDYQGATSAEILGETITSSFDGIGQNFDASVVFTENPNEYTSNGSYDAVVTTTVLGESQTETTSIDNFQSEGMWSRSGNTITFDGDLLNVDTTIPVIGMEEIMNDATILELTETTLRLGQNISQEIMQEGITATVTLTSEVVLTRQ
ncbi:lipocalin family protein [uncultured Dokdonia sp.]|uniref:lipocalin family protein n=1 Tax=uncultured Dokdonia sp. TaxID=575653 RepID=UPI00260DFF5E|nr:lipocalin family protein [uncultured Dokdonia sp.]